MDQDISQLVMKLEKSVTIFEADMSSWTNLDNKWKDILILGKGPTQVLGEHSLCAEKNY